MHQARKTRAAHWAGIIMIIALLALPMAATAGDKGRISLPYVEWASEVASTNVVRVVLEEAGYDVRMVSVSAAAMWQSVATGDQDAFVAAWLPTTHGHYLEQVQDRVEDLGPNMEGTRIGLAVPTYVEIDSIEELNDHRRQFGRQIIGIDPGAGIMSTTEDAIEEYGLNLRLVEGSDATMTGVLANAIRTNDWVVVTAWTPHWKEARWDLKYLEDPKGIYGGEEYVHTIVRAGLKDDMPEAYAILNNFNWTPEKMAELMVMNEEGGDPYDNAKRWVEQNRDLVDTWLP
ncbi:glycine/betaine ABC transporter substrate-binding protein [Ectothiorhodospira haloalkaliphila]|uniref:Glycine/betaine ABC transporter substrate-binding protein n=2 Tax=Ectothiorhodospiraceae TaxID=72276 RepID=W8KL39_9GAMM|nr:MULTISPECIES: glycine betaine ABC transporter substrate-binding protein [Ectothiorhodospira]AHK80514.1 glycine/betaine ABC transporter substrate-binding protein [Ectothiorhodospira haloalkaliphila]MCG5494710.1 glycine betaine ABC transporter substrate-binding protein [Ectothiorhodospira variabilis]MCG5496233.1 glycine betaine ABC transporter substrate-binding protein [Ectothiorhodospira variabilis]MCG5503526.1 glycine betaine ABC transporter substrate-binding protein [Ectothiorhodospira vari